MRLTSLQLTRYGPFEAERIAFDPRPGCINLLLAPNGAGKSVLRQAFCDLLFGIGGQTPMGFRYGYTGMRVFAEALAPDGTPFAFGRRKGQGNTLLDAEGNAVGAGSLAALLGQTDRALLERLFALDTERLRKGGEELLASDGALADALLSAGGMRTAKRLRQALEETRDGLAPTRKSGQKPYYRALDAFVDARKRAASALLRPDDWSRMERELAEAEDQQTARNQAAATASARIARLQRIRRVRHHLAERDAADTWLAAHPDAPDLAADLGSALAEARHRLAIAEDQLAAEQRRREQLTAEAAAISVDEALLAEADSIERLNEQAGAVRKALADIPKRESEHAELARRIAAALRDLGSALPVERAAEAIPPRAAVIRARDLIAQHSAHAASVAQAPGAIEAVRREMQDAEAQLLSLPAAEDTDALAALVAEIRAAGRPRRARRRTGADAGGQPGRAGGRAGAAGGVAGGRGGAAVAGAAAADPVRAACRRPAQGCRRPPDAGGRSGSRDGPPGRGAGAPGRDRRCRPDPGRDGGRPGAPAPRPRLAADLPARLHRRTADAGAGAGICRRAAAAAGLPKRGGIRRRFGRSAGARGRAGRGGRRGQAGGRCGGGCGAGGGRTPRKRPTHP